MKPDLFKAPACSRNQTLRYLNRKILEHPNFVNCLKIRTQEWLKIKAKQDWQYHVASNKKLLYPYSSFSIALQAHIQAEMSPRHVQFLNFWQDMFINNKIVDIDILPELPDGYAMAEGDFAKRNQDSRVSEEWKNLKIRKYEYESFGVSGGLPSSEEVRVVFQRTENNKLRFRIGWLFEDRKKERTKVHYEP
ncbi:hypothetical protein RhiirA4_487822 [Rhizophagus irregularis]|uniref:Uncharacterized protein n=1 Tax=Rhizophagus irregularis TaxID=588596 RepID=A0A2I1HT15_9GLOM|nr:hypothetical protein RhiirA4_487822 [Rhizophagus irregularis]